MEKSLSLSTVYIYIRKKKPVSEIGGIAESGTLNFFFFFLGEFSVGSRRIK